MDWRFKAKDIKDLNNEQMRVIPGHSLTAGQKDKSNPFFKMSRLLDKITSIVTIKKTANRPIDKLPLLFDTESHLLDFHYKQCKKMILDNGIDIAILEKMKLDQEKGILFIKLPREVINLNKDNGENLTDQLSRKMTPLSACCIGFLIKQLKINKNLKIRDSINLSLGRIFEQIEETSIFLEKKRRVHSKNGKKKSNKIQPQTEFLKELILKMQTPNLLNIKKELKKKNQKGSLVYEVCKDHGFEYEYLGTISDKIKYSVNNRTTQFSDSSLKSKISQLKKN